MPKRSLAFIIVVLLNSFSVRHAFALLPGDGGDGGGGGGQAYWANVVVRDQNNNPLSGVSVQLYVSVWCDQYYLDAKSVCGSQVLSLIKTTASKANYTIISETDASSTTRGSLSPSYSMMIDVDANGVADANEYSLASRFAPTLYLSHPTKWIAPEPVEIMASTSNLWCVMYYPNGDIYAEPLANVVARQNLTKLVYSNGNYSHNTKRLESDQYCIASTPSATQCNLTPGVMTRVLFFDWPGSDPNTWNSRYATERSSNQYNHTIYAHLFKLGSQYVVQYWFFYPYNDFINNHEGDWEHINVLITSQNINTADIVSVDYYFHHKTQRRTKGFDLDYEDQTHPRIYVGGKNPSYSGNNSGGSYPERGYWPDVVSLVGSTTSPDERVDANGPMLKWNVFVDANPSDDRGLVILKNHQYYDFNVTPSLSWLKASVHWGSNGSSSAWDWTGWDVGNNAPLGPTHNVGWEKIGEIPGSGGYSNYTIRPH